MAALTVAILQNQFRLSGRTKVVCEVIQLLNEMNIAPDVLTLTPATVGRDVGRFFGLESLRFNYVRVASVPFARGGSWQVLAINRLTRARHSRYDLVFNSNDALSGLNPAANYLHYVYYPLLTGADLDRVRSLPRRLYNSVLGWTLARSGEPLLNDAVYTISEFSRGALLNAYPALTGKVQLCYPPSFDGEIARNAERASRCVSVGSFIADKNQMEQLLIASQLPEIEFWIVGSARSRSYYRACEAYIQRAGLRNAHLKTDMPLAELKRLLTGSTFFLHTMRDEHFGMSTVEAMAAGCIPVVHNSGGQREVVPLERLRFDTTTEAVRVFRRLLAMRSGEMCEIRQTLQQHIQQFSRDAFREQMRTILERKLRF